MQNLSKRFTKTQLSQRVISLFSPQRLSLTIICFGILVRILQYLYNRSLWADEAVLALNIINRSYLGLLQPLDYDQGAPLGFLMVEKISVQLFGNNEYALRLFPVLSSIISLFILHELAKRCIQARAIPIALTLFSGLYYLVYYASEVKQYSSDVAISLASLLIAILYLKKDELRRSEILLCCSFGVVAVWFSHPAIFVLSGIGLSLLLISIVKKQKTKFIKIIVVISPWFLSFAVSYFVSLKNLSSSKNLLTSWTARGAFPASSFDIIWLFDNLGKFFSKPLGFTTWIDGVAIVAFVAGCVSLLITNKSNLFILLSPVFTTFFAAYLHKYPFEGRLVLFLSPIFILIIAEGSSYIKLKTRYNFLAVVGILISVLLIAQPLLNASIFIVKPILREEIKPVISYVEINQKPGDYLYVFQRGEYQFKYYATKYGYQDKDYIIGVDDLDRYDGKGVSDEEWKRYKSDLDKLQGNSRVWFLFSHVEVKTEHEMIKSYLDSIGKQLDFFKSTGSFVYLYNLS